MVKTISIGDLHGLNCWNKINPSLYDKIIFSGDYVDSYDISDNDILNNLLNIIQFKKDNIDKVILLWGNHDCQYRFSYDKYGCTGYRPQMKHDLQTIFNENNELFQMAYQIDNTLWTHAGVHEGWYDQRFREINIMHPELPISEKLNIAFRVEHKSLFDVGHRRGGYYNVGGPLWCDIMELSNKPFNELNQIVGHNLVGDIHKVYKYNKEIVFIDCLKNNNDKPNFYEKTFIK